MKNNSRHILLGQAGESIALNFLREKGHEILHRNYFAGHKEIDIISKHLGICIFTEIKTRSHTKFGYPEDAVTPRKQLLLKAAAAQYLQQCNHLMQIRFDILSIIIYRGTVQEILHFEDAFY